MLLLDVAMPPASNFTPERPRLLKMFKLMVYSKAYDRRGKERNYRGVRMGQRVPISR